MQAAELVCFRERERVGTGCQGRVEYGQIVPRACAASEQPDEVDFHDGKLDIASSNEFSNNMTVYLGNGDGSFVSRHDYGTGGGSAFIAAADLNFDTIPDLITANRPANTVSVFLGSFTGIFSPKTDYGVGSTLLSVAVGDFNRDSLSDLAVSNGAAVTSSVSILLGNGIGGFGPATNYPNATSSFCILVSDVNLDGKPDVVTANQESTTSPCFWGRGDGTLDARTEFNIGPLNESATVGDFNPAGGSSRGNNYRID
ncbi:MAG: VCBS repeat-containing protein [Blastocatellia bacterium]